MIFLRFLLRGPICGLSARRCSKNCPSKYTITPEKGLLFRTSLAAPYARLFSEWFFLLQTVFLHLSGPFLRNQGRNLS
jgi:hypothetical protein